MFVTAWGTSVAASVRVGNALGAGDASSAKFSARISMTIVCFIMIFTISILLSMRRAFGHIFTSDMAVIDLVAHVVPVAAFFEIFDFTQAIASGIMRGAGKQTMGAIFNSKQQDILTVLICNCSDQH